MDIEERARLRASMAHFDFPANHVQYRLLDALDAAEAREARLRKALTAGRNALTDEIDNESFETRSLDRRMCAIRDDLSAALAATKERP